MNNLTIKKRYFLTVMLICIISLAIVSSVSYMISYRLLLASTTSEVQSSSQRYSNEIESWLSAQADSLNNIEEDININSKYYNDKNLVNMLKEKVELTDGHVYDYYIGMADKRLLSGAGYQPSSDYDCTTRDWYTQAMNKNGLIYTSPYVDTDSKKMVITIAEPLIMNGHVVGVIAADIMVDYLVQLVNGINIMGDGYAFLIDSNKNIMTFHNERFLPTTRTKFQIGQILDGRFKLLADQIDSGVYKLTKLKDYDDREKFFFPAKINSSNWTLVLVFPASYIARNLHSLLLGFAFALIISLVVSMIVVFFFINGMLKPILELTKAVKQFGEKKFDARCEINSNDEIGELGRSFNSMAEIIQDYSLTLEKMVESRTKELSEKNRSIQDSIEYAGMIQRTILPDEEEIGKILKEYFVIWNPRDIVGGDFYWMKRFESGFVIAVGDCTGHGVPGALMTMAVSTILDRIADDICHDDPAVMLNELNRGLNQSLRKGKTGTGVTDGLDAGILCVLDNGKILYSGAKLSLFVIIDGEAAEIQGNKYSVGTELNQKSFDNQEIVFSPGMSLYLATDGIKDQVGGERHIPFGKKRLIAVLKSIQKYPMDEQKKAFWSEYSDYMKSETPRDDITMLGFRL